MATINPYAAPQALIVPRRVGEHPADQGAWRSGKLLVVAAGAELPDRCAKCGAPADGYRRRVRLAWHHPALFLGLIWGLLPYALLAILLTKRMTVHVGVCARHMDKRRKTIWLSWAGALAGVVVAFAAAASDGSGALFAAAAVLFIGSIAYGVFASRQVVAKKIDKQFAWVRGACPQYLSTLPEFPG